MIKRITITEALLGNLEVLVLDKLNVVIDQIFPKMFDKLKN